MATVSKVTTYDASKSIREDLSNIIYDISPTATPLMSNVGRDTCENTYFEWQTDQLASPDLSNAAIEGANAGDADYIPTNRVASYTQISTKVISVSNTADAVNAAGMRTVMAYEQAKAAKGLKRDMESILCSNQAATAGNSTTTPRKTAGLPAWLRTNAVANGATEPTMSSTDDGYPNAAWTDLTSPAALTEDMVKDAMQAAWTNGGEPSILMVGPFNKRKVSAFAGLAEQRIQYNNAKPLKIIATADVYLSDFGELAVVPSRFSPENFAFLIDPEYASVSYLRPFQTFDLAKTGDSAKKEMVVEYGLRVKNEKAHAIIANITTA